MIRHVLSPVLLSVFLLAATPVVAQTTAAEPETEQPTQADIQAFGQTKVTIKDAISAAGKHSGGTVIDAGFIARKGKPAYKVKTYQSNNNSVWEGLVDAQTAQVIGNGRTKQENKLDREDQAEIAGLRRVTLSLTQAVEATEKRDGAKAISAGLEEVKGKIVYEVMTVKNGSLRKFVIDSANGSFLK